jgi:hypothetical protein
MARSYKGNPNIVEDNNITYDFCIRALLCGWDEAWEEYQGQLCPLWPLLQWADEHIWKTTPFLVRLAYLRQSHCIMLVSHSSLTQLFIHPNPNSSLSLLKNRYPNGCYQGCKFPRSNLTKLTRWFRMAQTIYRHPPILDVSQNLKYSMHQLESND